jgi:hypothetical protein
VRPRRGAGFILASISGGLGSFAAAYLLIETFGTAATFVPLMADISFWFEDRRGIAIALCASDNYLSSAVRPTLIEAVYPHPRLARRPSGNRYFLPGVMPPLAMLLRGRRPVRVVGAALPAVSRHRIELRPAGPATSARNGRTRRLRGDVDDAGTHRRLLWRRGQ